MGTCPRHRRSIVVTAPLVFSMVSIFSPWTPLGTSVLQTPWFVPLSKFLAAPLVCLSVRLSVKHVNCDKTRELLPTLLHCMKVK